MQGVQYDCPQCGAALTFNGEDQCWSCLFCEGAFGLKELAGREAPPANPQASTAGQAFDAQAQGYSCPSCGACIITDATTAATYCVFCNNPTVLPAQLSGTYRPAQIIPFYTSKEQAQNALKTLCKGKPLLPKGYLNQAKLEKITGVYVPFWLFDCGVDASLFAEGRKVSTWSDSKYHYTKTDIYNVARKGGMRFARVPADGSNKMDDALMDTLEPYNYTALRPFQMPFLSGFLAERYDQDAGQVFPRVHTRMKNTAEQQLRATIRGYTSLTVRQMDIRANIHTADYVMLPVWLLVSTYKDKQYVFAMNGQTGKVVGNLPISAAKAWAWFLGFFGGGLLLGLILMLAEVFA